MTLYKFGSNDIFHNEIKTRPNVNFKIYDRNVYYNNHPRSSGSFVSNLGGIPTGYIDLYQNNVDRPAGQRIYPFVTKNGSLTSFKTIDSSDFNSDFAYGDTMSGSYPLSASISIDRFVSGQTRPHIDALRNVLNRYKILSSHFAYSSSFGNKATQELKLISIPSIFFGSSIEKGTITCKFFVTGNLAAELVDEKQNGELRQKFPQDSRSGSVAGLALYNEGFLIITGSWAIHPTHAEHYDIFAPGSNLSPRWLDFGTTGSTTPADLTNVASSTFELDFNGTNHVPVLTMFAHARKGELNFSNNPTYLTYGQTGSNLPITNSVQYKEHDDVEIKNTVKSPFIEPTGSFAKITYISKIGIYDKDKNLIGVAKVASPVRKREGDAFTFKLKLDF